MMRSVTALVLWVLASTAASGCSRPHTAPEGVLRTTENKKYGLTCVFHGDDAELEDGSRVQIVQYVSVRDAQGKEVRYTPEDAASLESSNGFFSDVWSPDEELLVLPSGRFEGFRIVRAANALERIANGTYDDFVRVEMETGARLWHEFVRWENATTFSFKAGLSDQLTAFSYDVEDRTVSTNEALSNSFIGIHSGGHTPIRTAAAPTGR